MKAKDETVHLPVAYEFRQVAGRIVNWPPPALEDLKLAEMPTYITLTYPQNSSEPVILELQIDTPTGFDTLARLELLPDEVRHGDQISVHYERLFYIVKKVTRADGISFVPHNYWLNVTLNMIKESSQRDAEDLNLRNSIQLNNEVFVFRKFDDDGDGGTTPLPCDDILKPVLDPVE